jgi:hypothetical protein
LSTSQPSSSNTISPINHRLVTFVTIPITLDRCQLPAIIGKSEKVFGQKTSLELSLLLEQTAQIPSLLSSGTFRGLPIIFVLPGIFERQVVP